MLFNSITFCVVDIVLIILNKFYQRSEIQNLAAENGLDSMSFPCILH